MVKKDIYLTKGEHICISSMSSSIVSLFTMLLLISGLILGFNFFIIILCGLFFYNLLSFFANYFRFNELLKKRKKNERRKTKRKTKR